MFRNRIFVLIVMLLLAAARIAPAQTWSDGVPGQLVGIPVYDPESKRYFALMRAQTDPSIFATWNRISEHVSQSAYKDVKGRLAIVDSIEVHEFLLRTFHPGPYQYIWIGLRYFCRAKKLEWSDGRLMQPGSFQLWDAQWTHDAYTCKDTTNPNDWGAVAYTPQMHSWIVSGHAKGYNWYFVEYPTGQP